MRDLPSSKSRHQLFPFAPVTAAAEGLQVGFFRSAALAARNNVIDFQIPRAATPSAAGTITNHYRCTDGIRERPPCAAKPRIIINRDDADKVSQPADVDGFGRPDEPAQLGRPVGQHVVHPRCEQKQTKQMGFLGIAEAAEAFIIEEIAGQPDFAAGAFELAEITKPEVLVHRF